MPKKSPDDLDPADLRTMSEEQVFERLAERGMTWRSCPTCHGQFKLSELRQSICPLCNYEFEVGLLDPVWHIDENVTGDRNAITALGALTSVIMPKGLKCCRICALVYPPAFAICPNLLIHAVHMVSAKRSVDVATELLNEHWDILESAIPGIISYPRERKIVKTIKRLASELGKIVPGRK